MLLTSQVTGSSRGIGAAVVTRLAFHGANVVVHYQSSPKAAAAVAEECRSLGVRAICVQADVSKPEPIVHPFKAAIDELGAIDIEMSNCGIEHFDDIPNVKGEDIDKVFDINVKGQFLVAQQAFAHVRDNGRVILMSFLSAVWVIFNPLSQQAKPKIANTIPRACLATPFTLRLKPPSKACSNVWQSILAPRTSPSIALLLAASRMICSSNKPKKLHSRWRKIDNRRARCTRQYYEPAEKTGCAGGCRRLGLAHCVAGGPVDDRSVLPLQWRGAYGDCMITCIRGFLVRVESDLICCMVCQDQHMYSSFHAEDLVFDIPLA